MSVSWQNRRRGQSLVANRKTEVKKLKGCSKIKCFKLRLKEQTDCELRIFRGITFQICGAA